MNEKNPDTIKMPTSEEMRRRAMQFLRAPILQWKDIPPGEGAILLPSRTLVVKLSTENWSTPEYHPECHVAELAIEALGNAQLLGVVIRTDNTRHDVKPGGLLTIAPNAEVEHVVWHGNRTA